jgi:aspartate/methionine/tyrosine aminotransferase
VPRWSAKAQAELGLPLVEDNPYGDLWFDTPPPLPLTARNPDGCIYLGSFSKVLAPGLRLGFHGGAQSRCTPSCCRPSRRPTCTAPASTSAWWPR